MRKIKLSKFRVIEAVHFLVQAVVPAANLGTHNGWKRPGKFAKKAARYKGKFMYLDRMTRSALSTAQGRID